MTSLTLSMFPDRVLNLFSDRYTRAVVVKFSGEREYADDVLLRGHLGMGMWAFTTRLAWSLARPFLAGLELAIAPEPEIRPARPRTATRPLAVRDLVSIRLCTPARGPDGLALGQLRSWPFLRVMMLL